MPVRTSTMAGINYKRLRTWTTMGAKYSMLMTLFWWQNQWCWPSPNLKTFIIILLKSALKMQEKLFQRPKIEHFSGRPYPRTHLQMCQSSLFNNVTYFDTPPAKEIAAPLGRVWRWSEVNVSELALCNWEDRIEGKLGKDKISCDWGWMWEWDEMIPMCHWMQLNSVL